MEAIGFPTYKYKLICFVIAGAVAGLAGALAANQNDIASPSMLHWNQSGMLIDHGDPRRHRNLPTAPALGATVLLLLEETLADYTLYWQLRDGRHRSSRSSCCCPVASRRCSERKPVPMADLLHIGGLVKRFGGLAATDGVDLSVRSPARSTR
jgi:hypothetical protein